MNSNSTTTTPKFDSLLLQSLMAKLQIGPPEDLLFKNSSSSSDDDDQEDDFNPNNGEESSAKTRLAKEETRLEKQIIRTILSGKIGSLKPNSGQAVTIGEHHICVGFHEDPGSDYRVWEWHGHVMLFDEENGYTPEYIYGNYFERVSVRTMTKKGNEVEEEEESEKEDKVVNLGLKELMIESNNEGRILRRNMNAVSPRV